MNTQNLGDKIKELRKTQGMTQLEFASEIGVGACHISNVERGQKTLSMDKLETVCKKFSINMSELMPVDEGDSTVQRERMISQILKVVETLDLPKLRIVKTMVCSLESIKK